MGAAFALPIVLSFSRPALADGDDEIVDVRIEKPEAEVKKEPSPQEARATPNGHAEPSRDRWYGWQTLVADGSSLVVMIVGAATQNAGVGVVGVLGYAFVPPIIHWTHGNIGTGFGSMAIRVVGPFVTAAMGYVLAGGTRRDSSGASSENADAGTAIGFVVGFFGAMAIDASVLAYERAPASKEASAAKRWYALTPSVDVRKDRASLGLGGTF
jgi:hypothetical protein